MKKHLAFAAILSALSIASSAAHADALIVIGEGPERGRPRPGSIAASPS